MKNLRLIDRPYVDRLIRKRPADFHKGDCGRILIVAGSRGMAGAAVLCARSALRSGVGLVRVSVPDDLLTIIQSSVIEATCVSRNLTKESLKEYQAIVIGPGLGMDKENRALLEMIIESECKAIVIDADALNIIAKEDLFETLKAVRDRLIITPHPGEAARLLSCSSEDIAKDRAGAALKLADKTGAVVVLKGKGTIIANSYGDIRMNTTGNPGMATGGCGDVLSGIIGSFCAQGMTCFDAASAGVYVHGMAGDLAADALGEYGLTAGDLTSTTALALKKILQEHGGKRKPQQIVVSAVKNTKRHKEN